MILPTKIRKI